MNNWIATLITFATTLVWLRLNNFIAQRGWISSDLSRKIIHMGTGPIYVLCWLLFKETPSARYMAVLVPFAITAQFILVGLGVIKDPDAVKSMSRSGDRREILRGPLYYGIVFMLMTIFYWRNSIIGIIALMLMCGGDGLADVIGRRFGKQKLPWNKGKSWFGSLAMFLGGFVFAYGITVIYIVIGMVSGQVFSYLLPVASIALGGTLVESLPFKDIDNITITIISLAIGHILL